ncbi:MAG: fructosamine kinase family protein [Myxococcota bacterium]|nr:fructosamine kinase family protein [Myxococcota bacterium]
MRLPEDVAEAVNVAMGAPPTDAKAVGGGCINEAARVDTAAGTCFVKWRPGAPPGFFAAEASGLRALAQSGTVRVPDVLKPPDRHDGALVLSWIEPASSGRAAMEDAGRHLAQLHSLRGLTPGADADGYIGTLPQGNAPSDDGAWLTFFRERRIEALAGALPSHLRRALEALPLEQLLSEPEGGCCLLHGDLWSGNIICADGGEGWLVDPAVYAGHPEVDLAMTRLFGGFSEAFYGAYQEVAGTLDREWEDRAMLLNLYPLLVHVHLFGGGYISQVEATVRRFQ